jgi:hypothetical protein
VPFREFEFRRLDPIIVIEEFSADVSKKLG